ncbi:MAG: hypothetical protein J1E95_10175 [Muribaculaceae bacterium]|nr:hypothetical protein [Muribaculaceae bacterium]
MKRKIILIPLIFCFFTILAQETAVTMTKSEFNNFKAVEDNLNQRIQILTSQIDSLENIVREKEGTINSLTNQIEIYLEKEKETSILLSNLNDKITNQKNEIETLIKEVSSLDMIRLRYANGRLELPFDKQKIKESIELFNGIQDQSLKEKYYEIPLLLSQYEEYNQLVGNLLSSLEKDERNNSIQLDEWKAFALKQLDNNKFSLEDRKHNLHIKYLNAIILTAKDRIEKSTRHRVDFSDLIQKVSTQ